MWVHFWCGKTRFIEDALISAVTSRRCRQWIAQGSSLRAGDGNRTRVSSLGSWRSAIELRPRANPQAYPPIHRYPALKSNPAHTPGHHPPMPRTPVPRPPSSRSLMAWGPLDAGKRAPTHQRACKIGSSRQQRQIAHPFWRHNSAARRLIVPSAPSRG